MIYQLGSFGYDEGDIEPNILLEHEQVFSEEQIRNMLRKHNSISEKEVAERLIKEEGFKLVEYKTIDIYGTY